MPSAPPTTTITNSPGRRGIWARSSRSLSDRLLVDALDGLAGQADRPVGHDGAPASSSSLVHRPTAATAQQVEDSSRPASWSWRCRTGGDHQAEPAQRRRQEGDGHRPSGRLPAGGRDAAGVDAPRRAGLGLVIGAGPTTAPGQPGRQGLADVAAGRVGEHGLAHVQRAVDLAAVGDDHREALREVLLDPGHVDADVGLDLVEQQADPLAAGTFSFLSVASMTPRLRTLGRSRVASTKIWSACSRATRTASLSAGRACR